MSLPTLLFFICLRLSLSGPASQIFVAAFVGALISAFVKSSMPVEFGLPLSFERAFTTLDFFSFKSSSKRTSFLGTTFLGTAFLGTALFYGNTLIGTTFLVVLALQLLSIELHLGLYEDQLFLLLEYLIELLFVIRLEASLVLVIQGSLLFDQAVDLLLVRDGLSHVVLCLLGTKVVPLFFQFVD